MNDYLIDTHVLLWAIFKPDKLTGRVAGILRDPEQTVYISVVSFWEISIKYALGKIVLGNHRAPEELQALSLTAGYREKPLTCSEAATFHQLPRLAHRDPFDRMLIMNTRKLVSFDWALKRLLRSKANYEVLEGFLSELLKDDIEILEILESESNRDNAHDKSNRVDLKVRNRKQEIILIALQYEREFDYLQRIRLRPPKPSPNTYPKGNPMDRSSR